MAVTPIDIQANMGHVHDVAKSTHAKNESVVQQHLFMDHKAEESSNRQKDTVQQNKESDQTRLNADTEKSEERRKRREREEKALAEKEKRKSIEIEDPALGQRVDFTR